MKLQISYNVSVNFQSDDKAEINGSFVFQLKGCQFINLTWKLKKKSSCF